MSLEPGREVERYVVQGLLGEGGMAEVYRVRHGTLGTNHALKVLTHTSRSVRQRLIQEGRLQATLRHPNIVAVTDVITVDGAPGLLMEFIEGPALDTWLMSYRPTLEEALTVFSGILAGVRSAHSKGLIHRDLKPANVLMHIEDGSVVPKVADFGLAKAVDGDGGVSKTKSGATMGTPAYMPPEQIRDASKVDKRADIFALGCILYELVCGRQCHQGEDIITLFNAIADADYPPPRQLVPDLPSNVEEAIVGALELDAEQRIPDCKTLQELLETPEGASSRIPMPTILPEDAPGAEAARSMMSVASFSDDVPALTSSASASGDTWLGEAGTDSGPGKKVAVVATESIAPMGGELGDSTSELHSELSTMRRQNMMMMGGTMFVAILIILLVVGSSAMIVVFALFGSPEPETVVLAPQPPPVVEVAPPVEPPPEVPVVEEPPPEEVEEPLVQVAARRAPLQHKAPAVETPPEEVPLDPPPVEDPEPPPPTGGHVVLSGDARMVMLVGPNGKFKSNANIPPGEYDVQAWFGAPNPVAAGRVTVSEGDTVNLKCVGLMAQCVRQ